MGVICTNLANKLGHHLVVCTDNYSDSQRDREVYNHRKNWERERLFRKESAENQEIIYKTYTGEWYIVE